MAEHPEPHATFFVPVCWVEEMMTVGSTWISNSGNVVRILSATPGERLHIMRLAPPAVAGTKVRVSRMAFLTAYDPDV